MQPMTGKQIYKMAQEMFKTDRVTPEQLAYAMDMLRPSSYLLRNHTIKNSPMTFTVSGRDDTKALGHRPWQIKMLNDPHPNFAVIKSRQLGLSELGVGKLIHFLDTRSYDAVKAIYTFPTGNQMKDFVKTRLDPNLRQGYYSTILDPDNDSLGVKKIRNSFVYFRTSSKPGALEGVDADYIALDEYDRVNALAESSAEQAMSSSKYKIFNRWSTPSIPDTGIHGLFQNSDQHHYLHKCEKCNYYNQMSYEDFDPSSIEAGGNILLQNPDGIDPLAKTVVPGSFIYVCKKCGKPLDRWYNGQWVAKYPDRTKYGNGIRGYLISQMNAVWISADKIKTLELEAKSKQAFYNYVLGFPYEDVKLSVTDSDVYSHHNEKTEFLQDRGDYKFVSMGIDWGNRHWITVTGMRSNGQIDLIGLHNVAKSGATDEMNIGADLEQVKLYINKVKPDIIVADVGDSGDRVAKLIQAYGAGRVFGCTYNSSPRSTGQLIPTWSDNSHTVKVDKLMQNKRYISLLKEGKIHHPKNPTIKDLQLYVEHWKNVFIRDEEDEKTGDFYQVIGRKGDDHYAQAGVYANIGLERLVDLYYGSGKYGFNSDFVNTQYDMEPEPTDIYNSH